MGGDVARIAMRLGCCCDDLGGLMFARNLRHVGDEIVMDA